MVPGPQALNTTSVIQLGLDLCLRACDSAGVVKSSQVSITYCLSGEEQGLKQCKLGG